MTVLPGAHDFTVNNSDLVDQSINIGQSTINQSTNINVDRSTTDKSTNINLGQSSHAQININKSTEEKKGLQTLLEASILEAAHNSSARYPPPRCHPGTRDDYIENLTNWGLNTGNHPTRMAWLKGPAGVGKSAIAQSCAEALGDKLGASFFLSLPDNRDDPDRFFTSISYQLAVKFESFGAIIDHKLIRNPTLVKKSLPHQFHELLVAPLKELEAKGEELTDQVIIVDGLDECASVEAQVDIVKIVADSIRNKTTPFLWIFLSRLEPDLVATFDLPDIKPLCLQIELVISREIDGEIVLYLTGKLREIGQKHGLPLSWPSSREIWAIVDLCNGLFALADTAVRLIGDDGSELYGPIDQLREVLYLAEHLTAKGPKHPLSGLDSSYTLIMERVPRGKLQIVQWILLATRLPGIDDARDNANLLDLTESQFRNACRFLHSVMRISSDNDVVFYHASFMDFLEDPKRSGRFCIWSDCAAALWDKIRCKLDQTRIRRELHAGVKYVPVPDLTWAPLDRSSEYDARHHGNLVHAFFALFRSVYLNDDAQRLSILMDFDFGKLCLYPAMRIDGIPVESLSQLIPQKFNLIRRSRIKSIVPFVRDKLRNHPISNFYTIGHGEKKALLEEWGSNAFLIKPYSARHYEATEGDVIGLLQTRILCSKDSYKTLLETKGAEAQRILDILQKLLSSPDAVDDAARRSILTALLRLSAASGLYPQQLKLRNIKCESSPITAGHFGEVFKGIYQGHQVCVKVFKLYQRSQIDHLSKNFSREAIIWSQLSHRNILPFYGIYHINDTHGRIGLVSPWMAGGNLPEYLKAHPNTPRLPFVHDILAGLRYLHRHHVVHGDLKGVNILIDTDGSVCLADFGLSSVVDADVLRWTSLKSMTHVGGTVRWTAPEVIEADGLPQPSFESDLYSLASVMFEVFTGQVPYYEFPRDATVISKVISGINPIRPEHDKAPELTDHIWEVMQNCWSKAPTDRPTADQVIEQLSENAPSLSQAQPEQAKHRSPGSTRQGTSLDSDITFLTKVLNLHTTYVV